VADVPTRQCILRRLTMAEKTAKARLDDTLEYMEEKLDQLQYDEIEKLVQQRPDRDTLSQNMSIGNSNPLTKSARRAKRSLMLLAQLFIADDLMRRDEVQRIKGLSEGSERDLVAEMKSWFPKAGVTGSDIAKVAKDNIALMPKWNNVNVVAKDAIRGKYFKDKPFNCYNACVFWAFQAGGISKRFLFNKLEGKDGNAFFPIFSKCGWKTLIEYDMTTKPPKLVKDDADGGEVNVPAGITVYFETPHKVFGHVACSLGDGTVISQNSVIPAQKAKVAAKWSGEVSKMERAVTHVISIRNLLDIHFHPENGYKRLLVTNGNFFDAYPLEER
jgi:hypothetical protein